ncbi:MULTISPECIES: DUF350 domain-containing protein [Brevibacterium]|uniref:DUF350 domain-containing protein n=2 Tax=Brevibacterium casei TaxID=33889 RepID=A0A269ZCM4_9MICO|nr:DUF350 domain-containing protein [Brevibacterium casei]NJE67537.1 DUF350 domain-containing protein [Brevibacterium sp. LS14]MCT1551450.1 DUF350 domain-containing protein [Brevibacterium casei]MCT1561483.1 DUF350 domain-containing protein [Brevibacterium casei]MCT2209149.1 DUF350 domain-containing protein [Brevibacterium casei]MCT2359771.1 DUF350 domain-containing protein [Brevibacterium casei]
MILDMLLYETGVVLAYAGSGILLMFVGYFVVDLLTPGKLHVILWEQKSPNAAVLVASDLLGVAIIVIAAIRASADDLGAGIVTTLLFGIIGIILMAVSFLLIDALTPGKRGDIVHASTLHPEVWVNASAHIGIAGIMAAALL